MAFGFIRRVLQKKTLQEKTLFPAIHIFGFHVPMYALMAVTGLISYVVCYIFLVEKKEKIDRVTSNRLLFVSFLGFVVMYFSALFFDGIYHSLETGKISFGSITWLGGVLGSFPAMVLGIHFLVPKAKGNAVYIFSLMVPGIVLGHFFGRLGCFFGGCCYGRPVAAGDAFAFLGVVFPEGSSAAKQYPGADGNSLPVYPTQLFEAIFELALFIVMLVSYKKTKKYNISIYFFAYGTFRFLIEFLRGDDRGSLGGVLSPSQWSSLFIIIAAILLILFQNGIIFKKLNEKCRIWREEAAKLSVTVINKKGRIDNVEMLRELQQLKREGIITEEEFKAKKQEILKRM